MPNHPDVAGLTDAVQRYFDLMYDSDVTLACSDRPHSSMGSARDK
jgi:hypothetical protein